MLGIAIINYNQYKKTIDCINSIFKTLHDIDYKIYLLDNASQNNSFEVLYEEYKSNPLVECIKSEVNHGYARGNNICLELAKRDGCDYTLISNNDIVFEENAINILYNKITKTDYLAIAPLLKSPDKNVQKNFKNEKPSFKKYMMSETYLWNLDKKGKYNAFSVPAEFTDMYWISGAVFIANMKKFEDIGFFDPNTFLYFEEYIISEKAVKKGYKLALEPSAVAYHYHGASTGGSANYITRLENFKSEIYFFKNYSNAKRKTLNQIRFIRCLEVLFTFTKEKKLKDALRYIIESKKVLKGKSK